MMIFHASFTRWDLYDLHDLHMFHQVGSCVI